MKTYITILALVSLFSCSSNKLISTEGINKIVVIASPLIEGETKETCITDKDSILQIINELNSAKKELAKFRPTFRLEINYQNEKKVIVLCNAQRINIEGITYILKSDIETILSIKNQ